MKKKIYVGMLAQVQIGRERVYTKSTTLYDSGCWGNTKFDGDNTYDSL
jgi:hypothetical protein